MKFASLFLLSLASLGQAGSVDYFVPEHRVSGIGVTRDDISSDLLSARTDLMIQSQTFVIMREAMAVAGARRVTGDPRLQSIFKQAAARSHLPATLIEAVAYLESWGDAKAESWVEGFAAPKGIMQISSATARDMGLKVLQATRYKISRDKIPVKSGGKIKYKTVTRKTPYVVTLRDDRMVPERAIPAAAVYLAGLEQKFGGRDWAIFAYHCGQGCVTEMQALTHRARGIPKDDFTVPRMYFSCSPAWNRDLYQAIQQQMQRDWSPTYYFRIMRAQELLALYRRDPEEFQALSREYKSEFVSAGRAPHRLSVWLKRDDLIYRTTDDIRADVSHRLVKALDRPGYFGYQLRLDPFETSKADFYAEASPAALGTLMYIAFETRRLFEESSHGEKFQPLPVTSLVEPQDGSHMAGKETLSHGSGYVFDIDYAGLPPAELECLRFVLDDLGDEGYLGFIEDGIESLHIGCAPGERAFFTTVFQEAVGTQKTE